MFRFPLLNKMAPPALYGMQGNPDSDKVHFYALFSIPVCYDTKDNRLPSYMQQKQMNSLGGYKTP
jgi:hypothetical protein